jgi:hypothetical protein
LSGHLRAAKHGDERSRGIGQRLAEITKLLFHQQTGTRFGHEPDNRFHGRVRAMRRTECVVHVHVCKRSESLPKRRVVLFFLRVEAQVLQEHDRAARRVVHDRFRRRSDAVVNERHRSLQQLACTRRNRTQAHLGIGFALRSAEV